MKKRLLYGFIAAATLAALELTVSSSMSRFHAVQLAFAIGLIMAIVIFEIEVKATR